MEREIKQLIDGIFSDYTLHFLAYAGGSGGEFLISKLREYSPIYRTKPESSYISGSNKTILNMNQFLTVIYFSRLDDGNLEDLKNLLLTEILRMGDGDIDKTRSLVESTRNLLNKNKPNLCKLHLTSNSYFDKTNTWSLYVDNANSFNYINRLRFIKVFKNKWSIDQIVENYKINYKKKDKLHLLDDLAIWASDKGISELEEIYLPCIFIDNIYKNFKNYDELMSHSPDMLYKTYHKELDLTYEAKENFYSDMSAKSNKIYFSRLLEPGYLESIFDITDPGFRKDLIGWHENNLRLLHEHNLDHDII